MARQTVSPVPAPVSASRLSWARAAPILLLVGLVAAFFLINSGGSKDEEDLKPMKLPSGAAPEGMAWIPGGTFWMGDPTSQDKDSPWHQVGVSGFWMDKNEVTNTEFAKFVQATGYKTVAERVPTQEMYPTAKPENLVAGSAVFKPVKLDRPAAQSDPMWWAYEKGADWMHPEGAGSDLKGRENHPAVQIAWEDAAAYAKWAGKRLPTEAEWEFAARGGLEKKPYVWGDDPQGTGGKYLANTFQGSFPDSDTGKDGFVRTAPVGSFPPNGYGLYDMSGNAWEWCSDWYDPEYYAASPKKNPQGPEKPDPKTFQEGQGQRVRRGGSFLCADDYCKRYLPGTRDKNPPDSSANHTGFRCVKEAK